MAAVGTKDPLDVLQQTFNDTLVHTGKAIRASQNHGAENIASAGGSTHGKMTETMGTYHLALNDVESEIVRAKAVLLRDLEKLRAARMPVPSPQPQPPPPVAAAPAHAPVSTAGPPPAAAAAPASASAADPPAVPVVAQTKQPPAVMMEMPSTAAHSVSANPKAEAKDEAKRVAPFPDMGMGMGGDVVDLTAGDSKSATVPVRPAPTAVAAATAAGAALVRPGPPVARATAPVKPSAKPAPPPRAAASATPQPPPPSTIGPGAQTAANPPQLTAPVATTQDNSMDAMLTLPTTEAAGGAAMADMTGGELNFTNMEFSLAPATEPPSQNAPPAPMAEFDLSSFSAPQDNGNDLLSLGNFGPGAGTTSGQASGAADGTANGTTAGSTASTQPPADPNTSASNNVDSLFDMGGGDSMDLDLNLDESGGMGESSFDDLFIPNDTDMGEFDETYFNMD